MKIKMPAAVARLGQMVVIRIGSWTFSTVVNVSHK
jgi:hypothetical protein